MKSFIVITLILFMLNGCSEAFPKNCKKEGYSGVVLVKNDEEMHGDCSNGDTFMFIDEEVYVTRQGSRDKRHHIYYTNEEYKKLLEGKK